MAKRAFDLISAAALLVVIAAPAFILGLAIFLEDLRNPFYVGRRAGKGGTSFGMVKFRSMGVGADRSGVSSTSADDLRITRVGAFARRFKLDELPQLLNVIRGDMSFVGPRPNVPQEVALYSDAERALLSVRPGITDFASIVFSDEGEILRASKDPDRDYNLLIRPWKSRLGLHYVGASSFWVDVRLIWMTLLSALSSSGARAGVARVLEATGADHDLVEVARRRVKLQPALPPGVVDADWEKHLPAARARHE